MFKIFDNKNVLLWILCFAAFGVSGQGLHFSYIEFAPQSVNPGLLGGFSGSYRGALLYRSQWNNSNVDGFNTLELSFDAPVIRGFRKQDWIGAGLSIDIDNRGSFKLRDRYSRFGVSYHFSLDKKQTSILTLGLQMIGVNRSIRPDQGSMGGFRTAYEIEQLTSDPELAMLATTADPETMRVTKSTSDFGGGLVYTRKGKTTGLRLGFSTTTLFKPNLSLATSGGLNYLPFKMIGFASFYNQINKKTSVEPMAFFQNTKYGSEFMINAKVGYNFKQNSKDKIKAGLGYRTGTSALIFFAGAYIKGIDFGLSYDMPFNGYANADGIQNSFELGASYVGLFKKTPKPTPIILCPRL